eukprot:scaffold2678_cov271-Chaetoceros_neogracile.AAC.4
MLPQPPGHIHYVTILTEKFLLRICFEVIMRIFKSYFAPVRMRAYWINATLKNGTHKVEMRTEVALWKL